AWPVGLLACATWIAAAALFRYSSLAALLALAASVGYAWWLADPQRGELAIFIAVLVWLRHLANIRRLATGNEPRIGRGGPPADAKADAKG
ncbi:MAG: glycerol-3-phosphate acyltransferase, partial [Alphaproteobacteria bacterium]